MFSDIIAVIALVLSGISLYWQWREKRMQLKVNPILERKPLPITSDGQGGFLQTETSTLTIYLANTSEKPIHVADVYICFPRGKAVQLDEFHALYKGLTKPFTIEPWRGHTFIVWGEKLAKIMKDNGINDTTRAKVSVRDEIGKKYYSRKVRLSISQLLYKQS